MLVHYAHLKKDLPGQVARLAKFIGVASTGAPWNDSASTGDYFGPVTVHGAPG
jgi:hypothetical protein